MSSPWIGHLALMGLDLASSFFAGFSDLSAGAAAIHRASVATTNAQVMLNFITTSPRVLLLFVLEILGVLFDEARPLRRKVFLREDRGHRALVDAQAAVDARVGVDVQHLGRLELRVFL